MTDGRIFRSINQGKRNFDGIYNQSDPRAYFATLSRLDYVIPGEAKPVFQSVLDGLRRTRELEAATVLDLGCSYGVNAALLKYDLELDELYGLYENEARLSPDALLQRDRAFFEAQEAAPGLRVIGLDAAENAVEYAVKAGLLDEGIAANLESETPTPEIAEALGRSDLIASTGCVGYVTGATFDRLLRPQPGADGAPPWVANFVLRMFPYDEVASTLADAGLVTEKLDGQSFAQRRFASEAEREHALRQLAEAGVDPGLEAAAGCYMAEFYLSRPAGEADALPLSRLLPAAEPPAPERPQPFA